MLPAGEATVSVQPRYWSYQVLKMDGVGSFSGMAESDWRGGGWRGTRSGNNRVRVELQLAEQHRLILTDMLGAEPIRAAMEVVAEVLDSVHVGTDRGLREVAALQLLDHELTSMGHRKDLLPAAQASRQPSMSVHEHA
jgi:hypothetical protein